MLLHELQRASFRGVPFLVPHDETEEGRHVVMHEYPDANQRYAEDNGRDAPKFQISAILAEPNLPAKVRQLRRALTQEGPGTLKHPWIGSQFVQVDNVKTKRSDKNAGYVEIEIKFVVTGPPQFPGLVSGIPAAVSTLSALSIKEIFAAFVAEFGNPNDLGAGVGATATTIGAAAGIVDLLSQASWSVLAAATATVGTTLQAHFGATSTAPGVIATESGLLIRDSSALADLFVTAFRAPFSTTAADDANLSDLQLLRGFRAVADVAQALAVDASAIPDTTLDFSNRQVALSILSGYIEAAAFVGLAETVAFRQYETADEVGHDETLLTNQYDALHSRDLAATVRASLREVYVAAASVLRDASVRLPRIVTVPASNTPCSVLAYLLYEDVFAKANERTVESRVGTLVKLNLEQTPLLLAGNATVVMRDA